MRQKKQINEKYEISKNIGNYKESSGITLISLVITIIILIILVGITINFALGKNGIFNRAKQAKSQYEISTAREKLELVLLDATTQKEVNKDYNNKEFLDKMLEKNGIEVNGSSVTVDNQVFLIDRDKLIVLESLGKTNIRVTKQVRSYKGKNQNNKYEVEALITIQSNKEIESITIKNPYGITTQMTEEELKTGKNIVLELDEEYIATIITKDGKEETRKIVEKSEEVIYSAKELAEFRNKVNTGLTYEGKTIKLGNDIDLADVCGKNINGKEVNWKPIGYYNTEEDYVFFKGIFNGEYKTIKNLYIKIDESNREKYDKKSDYIYVGLFGWSKGTIENLNMENVYIYVDTSSYSVANEQNQVIAAVTGESEGNLINIGVKSGSLTSINTAQASSEYRQQLVGGIVSGSYDEGSINNCYNNANISVTNSKYYSNNSSNRIIPHTLAGGIVGENSGSICNCYNTGKVEGYNSRVNALGGIVGRLYNEMLQNCYNYGAILGEGSYANTNLLGGIVGQNGYNSTNMGIITNSYCTTASAQYSYYHQNTNNKYTTGRIAEETLKGYSKILGEAFISDGKKIDKEGNVVDNLDSNENIIYINNGYPILKWQVTENK